MYMNILDAISFGAIVFFAGCFLQAVLDYYLLDRMDKIFNSACKECEINAHNRQDNK